MQRSASVLRKPAVKMERVIDQIMLDHEGRQKQRIVMNGEKGTTFLLDLEKATVLNDGDALKLDDGGLVLVKAAPESLLEIKADNPLRLMKAVLLIGNRHVPAELTADAIYVQDDHVLAELVRGQGCQIAHVSRPFKPEAGGHTHSHAHSHADHDHACGCGHDHHHDPHDHIHHHHDHAGGCCGGHHHHDHGHKHSHAAGGSCGCSHGHDHNHDHGHDHNHDHHGHDHHHGHHHKHD